MADETLVDAVIRRLTENELTLGTVECGVDGVVSRRIFDTLEGPGVLGNSLVADDVDYAIGIMDLPRPQFKKAGDFSAKAARAGAREGTGFLGVGMCLAVWGQLSGEETSPVVHLALNAGGDVVSQTFEVEGCGQEARDEVVRRALEMLWEALE